MTENSAIWDIGWAENRLSEGPNWHFAEIFGIGKLESLGYRTALFAWS